MKATTVLLGLLLGILLLPPACEAATAFYPDVLRKFVATASDEQLAKTIDDAIRTGLSLSQADYLLFAREIERRKSSVLADSTQRLFDRFVTHNYESRLYWESGYIRPSKNLLPLPNYVKNGYSATPKYRSQDRTVASHRKERTQNLQDVAEVLTSFSTNLVIWKKLPGWQIAGSEKGYDAKKWSVGDDWKLMESFSRKSPQHVAAYFRLLAAKNTSGGGLWSAAVISAKRSPAARVMAFRVGTELPRPPDKQLAALRGLGRRDRSAAVVGSYLAWLETHCRKDAERQREKYLRGPFLQRWSLARYDLFRYCPSLHAYKREHKTGDIVFVEEQRYLAATVTLTKLLAAKDASSEGQLERFEFALDHGRVCHTKATQKLVHALQQMGEKDRLKGLTKLSELICLRLRQNHSAAQKVAPMYAKALTTIKFGDDQARARSAQIIASIRSSLERRSSAHDED